MSHVVLAPDKFKGTLSAAQAAAHLAAGLERARPGLRVVPLPVADGGDGTVDAAVAAGYERAGAEVRGPAGEPVSAAFAFGGGIAVIESAQAAGLGRLPGGVPAPLTASSRGVGQLILAAAGLGAKRIVLGLGGVASTDGGAGLVTALGARLLDDSGAELPPGGGPWPGWPGSTCPGCGASAALTSWWLPTSTIPCSASTAPPQSTRRRRAPRRPR
jgi:glycerate 2-kinase